MRCPRGHLSLSCRRILGLSHIAIAAPYDHPMVKATVDALKYEGMQDLARPLAQVAAEAFSEQVGSLPDDAYFVPVPLHPKRERQRGFNQAELIAMELGEILRKPTRLILERVVETSPQVGLSGDERRSNLSRAIRVTRPMPVGIPVIVDDVTTTGSTIQACGRVLREGGAKTVWAVTVARG